MGCALVVADFVRKCVVGGRLAVLSNDAEPKEFEVEIRVGTVIGYPSVAAIVRGIADDEDDQVCAVAVPAVVDFVHVAFGVRVGAVTKADAGSIRQAQEVFPHIRVLGISRLVLVDESQTRCDSGVVVYPVGIVDREFEEKVDVSRCLPSRRSVGNQDIDHIAGVRGGSRRFGIVGSRLVRILRAVELFVDELILPAHEVPPTLGVPAKLRRVVLVDGRHSVSERTYLVEIDAVADVAQHVRALDDQGGLRVRCFVSCVDACEAVFVILDADADEDNCGARRRPGCPGRRRECE